MRIFEQLAGPLTVDKLLKAYRQANNLTVAQMEKKIGHHGKKKFTLKEALKIAKSLEEDPDFYALVWFHEEARAAGLEASKYLRDLR